MGVWLKCILVGTAVFLGAMTSACSSPPQSRVHFERSASDLASDDATVQARIVLEDCLEAMDAGEVERYNSLVTSDNAVTGLDGRIEVLGVEPLALEPGDLPGYQSPGATGRPTQEFRAFLAPIRVWDDGREPKEQGERVERIWYIVLTDSGEWRLHSWGSP